MIREYIYFVDDNPNGTSGMTEEEITRCKDCKHVEYTPASSWKRPYICRISSQGLGYCPNDGDGFCPYGERKESDDE